MCLLITLAFGQLFTQYVHACESMQMSDGEQHHEMMSHHDASHSMSNHEMSPADNSKMMDCCQECICTGATCSSLFLVIDSKLNNQRFSQHKKPSYQFSVIAAQLTLLQKPPIIA